MDKTQTELLHDIYRRLLDCYGPQHWWPGETPFEVIVGAILTQSTAWTNVEKAIVRLKQAGILDPAKLQLVSQSELAGLVHSCGYYNMKAKKLLAFVEWLNLRFDGSLDRMFETGTPELRMELLQVYGVGEETADSILLYAGNKAVFVIDAYTRRIFDRLGLPVGGPRYADYQAFCQSNLALDRSMFNEYHALLVAMGKNCCLKTNPGCQVCCLNPVCRYYSNDTPGALSI